MVVVGFFNGDKIASWSKTISFGKYYQLLQKKENFEKDLQNVFDFTKVSSDWMYKEDQELNKIQVESQAIIGYTTSEISFMFSIHSPKYIEHGSTLYYNWQA